MSIAPEASAVVDGLTGREPSAATSRDTDSQQLDDDSDVVSCSGEATPQETGVADDDEEAAEEHDNFDDNMHIVVGVSIGRAQTRLTLPETPAAEKAQALDHDTDEFPFEVQDASSVPSDSRDYAGSAPYQRFDGAIGSGSSHSSSRHRSSTGPYKGVRKLGPFSIPKSIDTSRLSISGLGSWLTGSEATATDCTRQKRNSAGFFSFISTKDSNDSGRSRELSTASQWMAFNDSNRMTSEPTELQQETGILRRSTSDTSLYLRKTLSHASSLGDDTRWQNVHGQVNSRFKALRDSLQDSTHRFPRLPNLSNFSIPSPIRPSSPDPTKLSELSMSQRELSDIPHGSSSPLQAFNGVQKASLSPALKPAESASPKHPNFTKALRNLEGDVVILGGYRGSVLRSAEPPHRQQWVPIKVGLNIRKVNLEVGLEAEDDEKATDTIIPSGMLQHIGPVDISRRLFKHLRSCENALSGKLRVHDYGYDWRLNPKVLSDKLVEFLAGLPSNAPEAKSHERGATVIAHSLGGLITRHAINRRPDLVSGVLYAGTPQTCVNILGPLRNGDDVLLSSKVLTAQVNFTIRTSYALLPLDGKCFFNPETKEEYPLDFFDVKTWEDHCLSPCIARAIPTITQSTGMVSNFVNSMSSVLPSISMPRRGSLSKRKSVAPDTPSLSPSLAPESAKDGIDSNDSISNHEKLSNSLNRGMSYQMDMPTVPKSAGHAPDASVSTAATIPKTDAIAYMIRTLADVKRFKEELAYMPSHAVHSLYPPATVIYGKSTPTVYGAKVASREAIKQSDAYENLAFASGDGVVLARASQLPHGYQVARGGCVSSSRGHVSLLGDLEAVGKCLIAIAREKKRRMRGSETVESSTSGLDATVS